MLRENCDICGFDFLPFWFIIQRSYTYQCSLKSVIKEIKNQLTSLQKCDGVKKDIEPHLICRQVEKVKNARLINSHEARGQECAQFGTATVCWTVVVCVVWTAGTLAVLPLAWSPITRREHRIPRTAVMCIRCCSNIIHFCCVWANYRQKLCIRFLLNPSNA
jgi:hypothetical protein